MASRENRAGCRALSCSGLHRREYRGVIEGREQRLAHFHPAPQPPATFVQFEHLTVSFPAPKVAIVTGEVVGTSTDGRRIYVVAFSDTFCRRHGQWLAVHAQETLALPPSQ